MECGTLHFKTFALQVTTSSAIEECVSKHRCPSIYSYGWSRYLPHDIEIRDQQSKDHTKYAVNHELELVNFIAVAILPSFSSGQIL